MLADNSSPPNGTVAVSSMKSCTEAMPGDWVGALLIQVLKAARIALLANLLALGVNGVAWSTWSIPKPTAPSAADTAAS